MSDWQLDEQLLEAQDKDARALIGRLRQELAARSLEHAAGCPSWSVYADWLLALGDPRGQWLALALAQDRQPELERFADAHTRSHDQRFGHSGAASLGALRRNRYGWARWFGPFALAAVQPSLTHQALMSALGAHAELLLDDRAVLGERWVASALERRRGQPTLLAVADAALVEPVASVLFATEARRRSEPLHADPGQAMPQVMPPVMAINPGPVYDPDAMQAAYAEMHVRGLAELLGRSTALLCCTHTADIERHANDWARIEQLGACVLVAPVALLEHWPHAGRRVTLDCAQ